MAEKKKIIDEKGRLFGKLNMIDLIILAVLIVALAVVGTKLAGRGRGVPGGGGGVTLHYTVAVARVPQEVYDAIETQVAAGPEENILMANGSLLTGSYVEGCSAVPSKTPVESAAGTFVVSEEPGYVDATFELTAVVSNPITQAVGTQEVRIGKSHIVKTQTYELMNGTILQMEKAE